MLHVRAVVASLCVLACAGCASVTQGTSQPLRIDTVTRESSELLGAECTLINDKEVKIAKSGTTTMVHRSGQALEIVCRKDGLPDAIATLLSRVNTAAFGNVLVGGVIGAAVDASSGAAYTYPHWVQLVFGEHAVLDRTQEVEGVAMRAPGAAHPSATPITAQAGPAPAKAPGDGTGSRPATLADDPAALKYRVVDRASHRTREVAVQPTVPDAEHPAGLGELDRLTPPDGWLPGGRVPAVSWGMHFESSLPGAATTYDLTAHGEGEETMSIGGSSVHVTRIGMDGFVEVRSGFLPVRAPYRATAWISQELHRVVRFDVYARAPGSYGGAAFLIDESAELVRVGRN